MSKDKNKKEITLMTLLANEATADSRRLLKKYGNIQASNHTDLEQKLAQLYFQMDDKIALEKELAEIHPHKNWLLKYIQPKVEIKPEDVKTEPNEIEKKSNFSNCSCSGKCPCNGSQNRCKCGSSAFDAQEKTASTVLRDKNNPAESPAGLIALVAVVGFTFYAFYALNKTLK